MADEGDFKIASAYVEVSTRDTTDADVAKIKAGIEATPPAKIKTEAQLDATKLKIEAQTAADRAKAQVILGAKLADAELLPEAKQAAAKAKAQVEFDATLKAADLKAKAALAGAEAKAEVQRTLSADPVPETKVKAKLDDSAPAELKAETEKAAKDAGNSGGGIMGGALAAGLLAAGPLVGAAFDGIAVAGLAGLAADLHSGDDLITGEWHQLQTTALNMAQKASENMVVPIGSAMNQIRTYLAGAEPEFRGLFSGAAQDLNPLTAGLVQLTQNALPGMRDALDNSLVVAQSLGGVEASLGSVIGNLGHTVANSSAQISTGLSQTSTLLGVTGTALDHVLTLATGLGTGALPVLTNTIGALSSGLGVLSGLGGNTQAFLGGLAASAGLGMVASNAFGGSLTSLGGKLTDTGGKLSDGGSKFSRYGDLVKNAGTALTQLGTSGLGIAAGGLEEIGSLLQQAYGSQATFNAGVTQGGDALRTAEDQATSFTNAVNGQDLAVNGAAGGWDYFWGKVAEGGDIVTGQTIPTLLNLEEALSPLQQAQKTYNDTVNESAATAPGAVDAALNLGMAYRQQGDYADATTTYQNALNVATRTQGVNSVAAVGAAQGLAAAQLDQATASSQASQAISYADNATKTWVTNAGNLSSALLDLSGKTSAMNSQMDLLSGGTADLSKAEQAANAVLLQFGQLSTKDTGYIKAHAKAMVDANGIINTSTQAGQDLNTVVMSGAHAYSEITTATYDRARATGQNETQAIQTATQAAQAYAGSLTGQLTKMGLTVDQAHAVETALGIIPKDVATEFHNNAPQAIQDAGNLKGAILNIPGVHNTTQTDNFLDRAIMAGNLRGAIQGIPGQHNTNQSDNFLGSLNRAAALNGGVRSVPNAWSTNYTNNFLSAINTASGLKGAIQSIPTNWMTTVTVNQKGPIGGHAVGGVVKLHAGGDVDSLTPMQPTAQVVPPNTWRVVGDRMSGDEAYIPLDGSARSKAIWSQAGNELGVLPSSGGSTITNHNTFNVSTQDPSTAVALLVAEQQWQKQLSGR